MKNKNYNARNRTIKVRLYPNNEQKEYFARCFGCCRFIWNRMLGDMQRFYDETGISFIPTPAKYKGEYTFLKEVDSLALANTQLHLQAAYKKFCTERNVGFPNFKSKKRSKNSYTTNCVVGKNGTANLEILDTHHLKLPIVGVVYIKLHRNIPDSWKFKAATVSQTKSGKYFVSLLFEMVVAVPEAASPTLKTTLGLDYSSPNFYVDSNGEVAHNEHYFRSAEKKLAREQRRLSRKQYSSKNYEKQKLKVAIVHEKAANKRKDFCHKKSAAIAKQYDLVCVEDINLRGMAGSLHLGKSTNDNGFGMFRTMLEYKLAAQGKRLVYIDKWYPSSKRCHDCGFINRKLELKDREWVCPQCGTLHSRDVNAALNIHDEGFIQYYKDIAFEKACA